MRVCGAGFAFRLVSAAGGLARNPEWTPELAGSRAFRHHSILTKALRLELRRLPSNSSFRYFFQQVDVSAPCTAISDLTSHGPEIIWMLRVKQAPEHITEPWIDTSWIVEVTARGNRVASLFHATQLFLTNLRTTPEALLQLVRCRWSIDGLHLIRDTQPH